MEAALMKHRPQPQSSSDDGLADEIHVLDERIRGLRNRWKEGGLDDEDYFDSLTHLRTDLQALRAREAASVVKQSRTETDALAVWRDEDMQNLERRRAIVASVIAECEVFSVGRGRKKPPELDSIRVWPVGAERDQAED
uniref:Uncharacterized protein n=1 Tax=Streptomyces auratus AGR0001 TaxID=1160718 RepID=J1ZLX9_9ACTN